MVDLSNEFCSTDNAILTPQDTEVFRSTAVPVTNDGAGNVDFLFERVPELANYFSISCKIGSGTFSSVYLAKLKGAEAEDKERGGGIMQQEKRLFALKHIIPTSHPTRIENELRCLRDIGGRDNIIGLTACIRHKDHVVIIMPYFPHDKFQDYVRNLCLEEIRLYMRSLLTALKRIHDFDLIHRDIKPSNFLYNRLLKRFVLVDFGLAQKAPVSLRSEISQSFQLATANLCDVTRKTDQSESNVRTKSTAEDDKDTNISTTLRKRKLEESNGDDCRSLPKRRRTGSRIRLDFDAATAADDKGSSNYSNEEVTNAQNKIPDEFQDTTHANKSNTNKASTGILKTSVQENCDTTTKNRQVEQMDGMPILTKISPGAKRVSSDNRRTSSGKTHTYQSSLVASFKVKNKSPRRALLTKRAMDVERRTSLNLSAGVTEELQNKNGVTRVTPSEVESNKSQVKSKSGVIDERVEVLSSVKSKSNGRLENENNEALEVCDCFNKPTVCKICLSRRSQVAPRAGTSGFRAPEVLMRHPDQTTSVDVWAAGVIFLSLLSGRYPFFKSSDDLTGLAQIMAVLGTDAVQVAANAIGKNLVTNACIAPVDMRQMCERLRGVSETASEKDKKPDQWVSAPDSAYDLLHRLLDPNPKTRATAEHALNHSFFDNNIK